MTIFCYIIKIYYFYVINSDIDKIMNFKTQLGLLGENMVATKLLERGWVAINLNNTLSNFPSVDIVAMRMCPDSHKHESVLIQVKTLKQEKEGQHLNFPTGFNCDKQVIKISLKMPSKVHTSLS